MKKAISILMSITMLVSSFGAMAITAGAAENGVIYENAFDTAEKVKELELVGDGPLDGTPNMAFDETKGQMWFEAWGQNTGFLLPAEVTAANFVMEADVIYEKKFDYRDHGIGYGFIFGYQDNGNFSDVVYYPLNGNLIMQNAVSGTAKSRNAEKGNGASFTIAENETAHLKLMVNDGKMEFYVNNELCYTFKSTEQSGDFRNFTQNGRLGLFFNADKTMVGVTDLVVREVKETDKAYYAEAYMGSNKSGTAIADRTLKPLSDFAPSYFVDNTIGDGSWGNITYSKAEGSGWDNTGVYLPTELKGNYTVDMNFAFVGPLNASRYMGFAVGLNKDETNSGVCTYTFVGAKVDGNMVMEQKTISNTSETTIDGSEATHNSCETTIPDDKKNKDVNTEYIVSYMPDGYNSEENADVMSRRHNMHIEVVDGTITFTFEDQTITLTPDKVSTDGYFAIRSAGTAARIYSLRVAPYVEDTSDEPIVPEEPVVTKEIKQVVAPTSANEGNAAAGYTAKFDISGGAKSVSGCKWTVTPSGGEAQTADFDMDNGGASIEGSVMFGLVVTAEDTKMLNSITVDAELK